MSHIKATLIYISWTTVTSDAISTLETAKLQRTILTFYKSAQFLPWCTISLDS